MILRFRKNVVLAILMLLSALFPALAASETSNEITQILFINSYHPGYGWGDEIERGIRNGLKSSGKKLEISVDYLDTKRNMDLKHLDPLADSLAIKYSLYDYEIIIVSDNNAFDFAIKHRERLFPGVPIVFCGFNDFTPSIIEKIGNVTGVNEAVEIKDTIDLALSVHPQTSRLVFLCSTERTTEERNYQHLVGSVLPAYKEKYKIDVLLNLSTDEIEERLRGLPAESLVFITAHPVNRRLVDFVPVEEFTRRISIASKAPIYAPWDNFIGSGVMGGAAISGLEQGQAAADMALRILNGRWADSIPVVMQSPVRNIFDHNAMKRFNISLEALPEKSLVVNEPFPSQEIRLTPAEKIWLKKHPSITLGFNPIMEPLLIQDKDGRLFGILPDLYVKVEKKLGVNINIKVGQWDEIAEEAARKEIDGLLACTTPLADAKGLLTSNPYYSSVPVIFIRSDAGFEVTAMKDLAGKRVAYYSEIKYWAKLLEPFKDTIHPVPVFKRGEGFNLLLNGKVDAILSSEIDRYFISNYRLSNLKSAYFLLENPLPVRVGVRPDWPEFVSIMNKFWLAMGQEELNSIADKWLPEMPATVEKGLIEFTDEEHAWLQNSPMIRVGIAPDIEPVMFRGSDNTMKGLFVDYLHAIQERTGLRFEPVFLSFSDILLNMKNGEIDLFPGIRTPEREEYADFSKPFYTIDYAVVNRLEEPFVNNVTALYGKKVTVVQGVKMHGFLAEQHPRITLLPRANLHDAFHDVANGQAYGYAGSITSASYHIRKQKHLNLKIAFKADVPEDLVRFGVSRENTLLLGIINKVLASMSQEEHDAIEAKWVQVEFADAVDISSYLRTVLAAAAAVVLALLIFVLWNRQLKIQVSLRTESLRKSEEKVRKILSSSPVAIAVFDSANNIIDINTRFMDIFGYTLEDIPTVDHWWSLAYPDAEYRGEVKNEWLKRVETARQRAEPFQPMEAKVSGKDGRLRHIEFNVESIGDVSIVSLNDLTERKKAEEALRAIAKTFAAHSGTKLFESVCEHLTTALEVDYAFVGELIGGQDKIRAVGGYAKGKPMQPFEYELAGTPCANVACQSACVYPSGVQGLFPEDELLVEMGVEGYFGAPLFDHGGAAIGIFVILHSKPIQNVEIAENLFAIFSERLSVEIERDRILGNLQISERFFHSIVEDQTEMIVRWLPNGVRTFVNDSYCLYFGKSREELIGSSIFPLVAPEDQKSVQQRLEDLTPGDPISTEEHQVILPDGRRGWNQWTDRAFFDEAGNVKGYQSVGRDITARKQMEKELHEAQMHYTDFINVSSDSIGYWKVPPGLKRDLPVKSQVEMLYRSVCVDCNKAILKDYGLIDKNELIGRQYIDLVKEKTYDQAFAEFINNGYRLENYLVVEKSHHGGTYYGYETWYGAVKDEILTNIWTYSKNITEQKMAEEALNEELLITKAISALSHFLISPDLAVEDITNRVFYFAKQLTSSRHGYVAVVEKETGNMVNYTFSAMMEECRVSGEDQRVVFPPGEDGRYSKLWGHALNTREPFFTNNPSSHEVSGGIPPGHIDINNFLTVPVVFSDRLIGQIALANKEGGYSDKDLEVTRRLADLYAAALGRTESDAALRKSEEQYRRLVEEIPGILYSFSDKRGGMFYSPQIESILGYPKSEFFDDPFKWRDLIHEEDSAKVDEAIQGVRAGRSYSLDYRIKDSGGRWHWLHDRSIGFHQEGDEVLVEGLATDFTEKKHLAAEAKSREQQLLQADKMAALGTLVAGIAHEINNPNTLIMSNAQFFADAWKAAGIILEEYYQENGDFNIGGIPYQQFREKFPSLCQALLEGSQRIKRIVEELRTFSRKDIGEINEFIQVNNIIQSALVLLSNLIKKSTTNFHLELQDELPGIKGNYQRLEQVVINLIQNACQALPDKEKGVFVSTSHQPGSPEIVVVCRDEGCGIPDESLNHVTEPFFTTKREAGGTGLGLSICSTIIQEHNGTMEFASVPGEGTVVTLKLPVDGMG